MNIRSFLDISSNEEFVQWSLAYSVDEAVNGAETTCEEIDAWISNNFHWLKEHITINYRDSTSVQIWFDIADAEWAVWCNDGYFSLLMDMYSNLKLSVNSTAI